MAWVYVVNGANFKLSESDSEDELSDLQRAIRDSQEFRALERETDEEGLFLRCTLNKENRTVDVIVGTELFPERHLYTGLTVACPSRTSQSEKVSNLADRMERFLKEKFPRNFLERQDGIVICRWE